MDGDHSGPLMPATRLRVGVTGHRGPPRLPREAEVPLRASVDKVLAAIAEGARKENEVLRSRLGPASAGAPAAGLVVVSSLAEGADRIIAEAGIAAGFDHQAILPFERKEYARDFETQESKAAFEQLLNHASAVLELNGDSGNRPRAYEAAGLVMLSNVDLLIAVWDGCEGEGIGSTSEVVGHAISEGIPIIWIYPTAPFQLYLSWAEQGASPLACAQQRDAFEPVEIAKIGEVVRDLVLPLMDDAEEKSLNLYLFEREKRWNFFQWYLVLLFFLAGRRFRWRDVRPLALSQQRKEVWEKYFSSISSDRSQRPLIEHTLLPAHSIADHLAVYYSLAYRSTYVFNFMLAAFASTFALLGGFFHDPLEKSGLVFIELLLISVILFSWQYGQRHQWHRRWLDYRRLAESLRHIRILAVLGLGGPIPRTGRIVAPIQRDWVNWYVHSLRRTIPLPDRKIDAAYLRSVCGALSKVEIAEQLRYHEDRLVQMTDVENNLRACGKWLFILTGLLCITFIVSVWGFGFPAADHPRKDLFLSLFEFTTALLPTFGAALGAIHVQGDFKTVAAQSNLIALRLKAIDEILKRDPASFARLSDHVEKASDVMMTEVAEWRTVFRTRPLSLPV